MPQEAIVNKIAKNLFLDPAVIEHGAAYGRQHGTTLSRLVSDFLSGLSLEGDRSAHPVFPAVQRLLGAALPKRKKGKKGKKGPKEGDTNHAGVGRHANEDYHDHLATKHGSR